MGTTHYMRLAAAPFRMIANGQKTVEIRLYDEKRKAIARDDFICFTEVESERSLTVRVKGLTRFKTFIELMQSDLFGQTGSDGYTPEEAAESMYKYYTPEQEKKYGVVAIEIELIQN